MKLTKQQLKEIIREELKNITSITESNIQDIAKKLKDGVFQERGDKSSRSSVIDTKVNGSQIVVKTKKGVYKISQKEADDLVEYGESKFYIFDHDSERL
jgi:hypothetical protein